jgi:hypothetical protein
MINAVNAQRTSDTAQPFNSITSMRQKSMYVAHVPLLYLRPVAQYRRFEKSRALPTRTSKNLLDEQYVEDW